MVFWLFGSVSWLLPFIDEMFGHCEFDLEFSILFLFSQSLNSSSGEPILMNFQSKKIPGCSLKKLRIMHRFDFFKMTNTDKPLHQKAHFQSVNNQNVVDVVCKHDRMRK